jgi:putative phage-type endonuclease
MIEVISPKSRDEWLELRKSTIGASESAILLGANPYSTPYELWARKSGQAPPEAETPSMRRGKKLEQVALDILREERPSWIVESNQIPGGLFFRDLDAGVSCTPDVFAISPERQGSGVVQVKAPSPGSFRKNWQVDGNIEPPMYAVIQAIQEAALTGASWACVAALVVDQGIDLHLIEVPIRADIMARIRTATAEFWQRIRASDPYPPDYELDGDTIKSIYADDNGGTIDLSGNKRVADLLSRRDQCKDLEGAGAEAAKRRRTIDVELVHLLGNATRGTLGDGRVIEAPTVRRAGYTVAAGSYRVVRIKEEKHI